ncbi:hypothetical protein [Mitsuaria sp. GD03876]|uniref:hypothetical protein n=1 Tax=Mitsuaria sp. GD03876 TaxID=2975399 RepID=UPI002448A913|nr:hypothetical protein [Mitsuaria sp. GD03876]MDH0867678.1 hypothetical protein [Mitsuaria sp. GD03876]
MDTRLSQAWHGWRSHARTAPATNDERAMHRFSDGALHTVLMAAIIAVAVMAVAQMISVGVRMWQLDPVVVQGKSQNLPMPAAPQPLEQTQPKR